MGTAAVNGGLVVASVVVALFLGEFALRAAIGRAAERTLYFSPHALVAGEGGAVHYQPASRVRTKAVYDGVVEYDVTFPVNDLGHIDPDDYRPTASDRAADRAVAVVGDSFTAGYHGGEPWVPKLRSMPELRGRAVYNLGVDGVGTAAFLNHVRAAGGTLAFDTVLTVGLSADFTRPVWRPVEHGGRLWFCPLGEDDDTCRAAPTAIEILEEGARPSAASTGGKGGDLTERAREFARGVFPALFALQHEFRMSRRLAADVPRAAAEHFSEFRRWAGERTLLFLHVPAREEVMRNSFVAPIRELAETNGIVYVSGLECGLRPDDFLPRDPHPNASGYDKIRACAAAALGRVLK